MDDQFLKRASNEIKRTTREAQGLNLTDLQDTLKRALDAGFGDVLRDFLDVFVLNTDLELGEFGQRVQLRSDFKIEADDVLAEMNEGQVIEARNLLYHAFIEAFMNLNLGARLDQLEKPEQVQEPDGDPPIEPGPLSK